MSQTNSPLFPRIRARLDWIIGAELFLITLALYLFTLAPSVAYLFDDSLEFQLLASRMAIAHPTGYPLYSILIKLATFLPVGDVAFRVNLVSAVCGALAVAFVYLAGRQLTDRFFNPGSEVGEILVRAPAFIAALIFAVGETFWSQAVLAEVYTLQALLMALMLWLVLRWGAARGTTPRPSLIPIAFLGGLMLTHHRMSVLIFPALLVYVLLCDHSFLREPRTLLKLALAFVIPLLLYLYLPIRGAVTSSLDGTYQNTPSGFLNWILGTAYTVFLTQNPLNQTRDAAYYWDLFVGDFTLPGLVLAVGGFFALFLRAWREWLLLALALAANLIFVFTYTVADINVFFIPGFLLISLFLAAGLAGLLWLVYYNWSNRYVTAVATVGALLLLLIPLSLFQSHYARVDLSNKTDIADYGRTMLSQPLANNATLIGILGEMTLVRYFQETEGLRPDVETIAADKEADRQKAIDDALARGRTVYLTRPLTDIEKKDSLSSVGPLIQVEPKPNKKQAPALEHALNADFGDVTLLGYALNSEAYDGGGVGGIRRIIPLTLAWQVKNRITNNLLISLKLIDARGRLAGQLDRQPVLDAYPTSAWRPGEYISDYYELPVFVGAAPGTYTLQATLYDPDSGKVYGQQALEQVNVPPQTNNVPRDVLDATTVVLRDLNGIELVGYTFDTTDGFPQGATMPLTLLWRAPQAGTTREFHVTVEDQIGQIIHSQTETAGGPNVVAGQYLRQDVGVALPKAMAAGRYIVRLTVPGGLNLPFVSNSIMLGIVKVTAK